MSTAAAGLSVEDVHVWRGDRHVLRGVSFELQPGEAVHATGANGSGKTTLLRVVCGLSRPEQGRVSWGGAAIAAVRSDFQRALAYGSHEAALKSELTALENLHYNIGLKRRATAHELRDCLQRAGVDDCADLRVRVLSAGQQRRVALARVLAARAALWLLDEPYTHLDATGARLLTRLLDEHVRAGGSALLTAHHDLQLARPARRLSLDS